VTGSRHRSARSKNPDVPHASCRPTTQPNKRERPVTGPVRALLRASHLLAPDDLAATVAAHATAAGLRDVVLYLTDYAQGTLLPLPGTGVPERQQLPIEGTMAGRAFRRSRRSRARPSRARTGCGFPCWTASSAWASSSWTWHGSRPTNSWTTSRPS